MWKKWNSHTPGGYAIILEHSLAVFNKLNMHLSYDYSLCVCLCVCLCVSECLYACVCLYSFQEISPFVLSCQIYECKLHHILLLSSDVCRVCTDLSCFISNIISPFLLLIFVSFAIDLSILLIFPKN